MKQAEPGQKTFKSKNELRKKGLKMKEKMNETMNETMMKSNDDTDIPLMLEEAPKGISRVMEVPKLRTENRKVFCMSDGTKQAVFYPSPIHVFDKETKMYEEAVHTLTEETDGSSAMTTYSWSNGVVSAGSLHMVGGSGTGSTICQANRMYMELQMPKLPRNPRIKKAELTFFQYSGADICSGTYPKIGLYQVEEEICTGVSFEILH